MTKYKHKKLGYEAVSWTPTSYRYNVPNSPQSFVVNRALIEEGDDWELVPEPKLYKTSDGAEFPLGCVLYCITDKKGPIGSALFSEAAYNNSNVVNHKSGLRFFSTQTSAEKWLKDNEPILSRVDVVSLSPFMSDSLRLKFLELLDSKS